MGVPANEPRGCADCVGCTVHWACRQNAREISGAGPDIAQIGRRIAVIRALPKLHLQLDVTFVRVTSCFVRRDLVTADARYNHYGQYSEYRQHEHQLGERKGLAERQSIRDVFHSLFDRIDHVEHGQVNRH